MALHPRASTYDQDGPTRHMLLATHARPVFAAFDIRGFVTPECANVRAERLDAAQALNDARTSRLVRCRTYQVGGFVAPSVPTYEQHGLTKYMLSTTPARLVPCNILRRTHVGFVTPRHKQHGSMKHMLPTTQARLVVRGGFGFVVRHSTRSPQRTTRLVPGGILRNRW